jgi:hypothetical protein
LPVPDQRCHDLDLIHPKPESRCHRIVSLFGSPTLWTDLLAHRLFDELHLMIGPEIVAGDHPVFAGACLRPTWGGSDSVVLSYATGGSRR